MKIVKCDGQKIYFDDGHIISYSCDPEVKDSELWYFELTDTEYKPSALIKNDRDNKGRFVLTDGVNRCYLRVFSKEKTFVNMCINGEFICGQYNR